MNFAERVYEDLAISNLVKEISVSLHMEELEKAIDLIVKCMQLGNKLIVCGNGGSAADSQHIVAEFIGRFQHERKALPAIALTTNSSILTALGNDYNYDIIFSRQLEALGKPGDVVLGISTSGNSKNVIRAIQKAKELGLSYITLTGNDGGELKKLGGINLNVYYKSTARIQESHIFIYHIICQFVEESFLQKKE